MTRLGEMGPLVVFLILMRMLLLNLHLVSVHWPVFNLHPLLCVMEYILSILSLSGVTTMMPYYILSKALSLSIEMII